MCHKVGIHFSSTTEIQQWMYKTSVLRIDYLWMYVISPWVVKMWEFSFPKLKNKNYPFFLISRICVSHWKKSFFWRNGYEHGCTLWSGLAGPARAVPSGVLPTNSSPIRAVCIEMHGNCSTNDGTTVGQQRWEFSGAWPKVNQAVRRPPPKLTSIRLVVSAQTHRLDGELKAYICQENRR